MKKKLMVFFMLITLLLTTAVGCGATAATGTKVTLNEVAHSVLCTDKSNISKTP